MVNYQIQEDTDKGWAWFSDFMSYSQAKNMLEVYRKFYPIKKFRIVRTDAGLWDGE